MATAGTYLAPNSIDTGPLGAYLTELTANDTQLSFGVNTGRDLGGGERMWLVVDWVTAPTGGTSIDMQLITSASSALSAPIVMYDFGVVTTANLTGPTAYGKSVRQVGALPRSVAYLQWLGLQAVTVGTFSGGAYCAFITKDVDSVVLGYSSGYGIK